MGQEGYERGRRYVNTYTMEEDLMRKGFEVQPLEDKKFSFTLRVEEIRRLEET